MSPWTAGLLTAIVLSASLGPAVAFALDPAPAQSLTVTPGTQSPVLATLEWTPSPDAAVVSYDVQVSTAASGPFRTFEQTSDTRAVFTDGLGGLPYYFRIVARTADGETSSPLDQGPVTAQWSGSPHGAVSTGSNNCAKCHSVHRAQTALIQRAELPTDTPGATATCYGCHSGLVADSANIASGTVDSFGLNSGHSIDASSSDMTAACSSCHSTHSNSELSPMLPGRVVNGSVVETVGPVWCVSCHDDSNGWYDGTYPSVSSPDRDGAGYPIAGVWPGLATYEATANAHAALPETTRTAGDGGVARRVAGDCLYCHASHRGVNQYDGLLKQFRPTQSSTLASDQADGTYATLCFDCHDGTTPVGFAAAPANIKSFATGAGETSGHRIKTAGGTLPVGSPLPCYDCHNPHGSTRGNASNISDELGGSLETSSAAGVRAFCFTCHTTSDTGAGWSRSDGGYIAVSSGDEVEGLSRTAGVLGLPVLDAHSEADTRSCYSCHGDDYTTPDGFNVHRPSADVQYDQARHSAEPTATEISIGGTSYGVKQCTDCHETALGAEHAKATSSSAAAGCSTCHPSPQDTLTTWEKGCVQGGCHAAATPSAQHSQIETAHASQVLMPNQGCYAVGCHSGDLAGLHASAETTGTTGTVTSCAVCHDTGVPATAICSDCHSSVDHAATHSQAATQSIEITVGSPGTSAIVSSGVVSCDSCHSMNLPTQHEQQCASCHPIAQAAPAWDGTCISAGCHATPQHSEVATAHAPNPAESCFAGGCHPSLADQSFAETHQEASITTQSVTFTSCMVCHVTTPDASGGCATAGCHEDRLQPHD